MPIDLLRFTGQTPGAHESIAIISQKKKPAVKQVLSSSSSGYLTKSTHRPPNSFRRVSEAASLEEAVSGLVGIVGILPGFDLPAGFASVFVSS